MYWLVTYVVEDSQADPESDGSTRSTKSWNTLDYGKEIGKTDPFGREKLSRQWINCGLKCHGNEHLLKNQMNISYEQLNISYEQMNISYEQMNISYEQMNISYEQMNISSQSRGPNFVHKDRC
ncbi:hypothetical protein WDU94_014137 [Cyamophila willieti]